MDPQGFSEMTPLDQCYEDFDKTKLKTVIEDEIKIY